MNKENIKTTDWLTRGISKEQLEQEKQEAIMSADLEECISFNVWAERETGETTVDYDYVAEKMVAKGYRKQREGCGFCGTTLYVKTVQHTMPVLAPLTRAEELRQELINLTGEIYLPIEARFCPLCGAKMDKE